ncbi:hypothetical protein GURASL_30020 [Geotalea uraniireducens]|uniref:GATA-type domain-containing protein n=1 Tax=Geotalea uraniireducens TaxID=351604 RepID=A0ABN6VUR1_9BACT|nr:hypothetical protein [Geotalea uraniireducens]BDV44079.1 hypothetical protein GURASL_30020 [Geotalea uraniireducens]
MNIIPLGDYYAWYCEWCDTKNLVLQQRFAAGTVTCGACHRQFAHPDPQPERERYALAGGL